MTEELIGTLVTQAPTIGVLLFLVWRQQVLIDKVVTECLEDEDDDE